MQKGCTTLLHLCIMNRIELTNFRIFEKETCFDLAPITILTGKNNSGKSSLLKSFILLSDYLATEEDQTVLNLNGKGANKHKINSFGNLRNWSHKFNAVSGGSGYVKFSYKKAEFFFEFIFDGMPDDTLLSLVSFRIENNKIDKDLLLKRNSSISYPEFSLSVSQQFIDYLTKDETERYAVADENKVLEHYNKLKKRLNEIVHAMSNVNSTFDGLQDIIIERQELEMKISLLQDQVSTRKTGRKSKSKKRGVFYQTEIQFHEHNQSLSSYSLPKIIQAGLLKYIDVDKAYKFRSETDERRTLLIFSEKLSKLLNFNAHHLGPNRTYQSRLYLKNDKDSEINSIVEEYFQSIPYGGTTADLFLKKWLKGFALGEDLIVESVEGLANKISLIRNERKISLADMGFGAGQLLTILLRVTSIINLIDNNRKPKTNFVLIEEPEANLHPKLQSLLADFFAEASLKFKLQFVLETHSEYLIRKTQVLVKEQHIGNLFKVYYFDDKGPYEVRYREDGVFIDEFGPGFFDESAALTFELL